MNGVIQRHRQRKRMPAWLLLACVFLWLLIIGPQGVKAHALLVRSIPEANAELATPPATIEMWFSEPLEAGFSKARLLDSQGQELPTGAVNLDPSDPMHMTLPLGQLEPGIYTVAWQTLSRADGHEWYGSFPLTLLNPDGSRPTATATTTDGGERGELPSPGEVVARWLVLLGGFLLFGVPLFQIVVVLVGEPNTALALPWRNLALKLVWLAVVAIVLGAWLQVILQAARLGGLGQLPTLLLETRTGTLAFARQALAFTSLVIILRLPQPRPLHQQKWPFLLISGVYSGLVILLLLFTTSQDTRILALVLLVGLGGALFSITHHADPPTLERRTWHMALALSSVLLFTLSLGSHANAGPGNVWAVLGDFVHLLAAAAWIGGLALLPGLIGQIRRLAAPTDYPQNLLLIRRFSYLASFAVFVMMATGLFSSLVQLPSFSSLWTTPYGLVLLTKLILIAFTLEVAFFNNRLIHHKASQLTNPDGWVRLYRQIVTEAVISLGITLSVAILVQTSTPRSFTQTSDVAPPNLPFNTIAQADDLYLHVQVTPNQVGYNRFWVHLYHPDGGSIGEVQLVRLLFNYRQEQFGQARADLVALGQDTFATEGAYLNAAGLWNLSVYVRRRDRDDALTKVNLEIPPLIVSAAGANPWGNPMSALPAGMLIAAALVVLGLIPWLWRQPLQEIFGLKPANPNIWTWPPSGLILSGGITILSGLIIAVTATPALLARLNSDSTVSGASASASTARFDPAGEPVPASPGSIAAGAELYQEQCVPCHGPKGLGDGQRAAGMEPPPANFRIHVPLHSDRELHGYISRGFPGTDMPAFADDLTTEEIWHLVNYLRAEFG
ncbi:MAG: copper resistance protein CopC [Anaerolineales bacterium]|nr:copper resistance protein CopC [Anaerolineales bacterium]